MSRVLITGATRGLGRALALDFAARGARLAVCARGAEGLSRLQSDLSGLPGGADIFAAVDLADPAAAGRFAGDALEALGGLDVLIHNASLLGPRVPLVEYPDGIFREVMRVNATAPYILTRAILPEMLRQGSGSIISVSSSVGEVAKPRWGAYLVSKFALEGMSRMLAAELQGTGVRVNIVNPGAMRTRMRRDAYPDEDPASLRRPEDLLEVFRYLASDASREVTGRRFEAARFQLE